MQHSARTVEAERAQRLPGFRTTLFGHSGQALYEEAGLLVFGVVAVIVTVDEIVLGGQTLVSGKAFEIVVDHLPGLADLALVQVAAACLGLLHQLRGIGRHQLG